LYIQLNTEGFYYDTPRNTSQKRYRKTLGLSRSTIYAMMADGRFPKPVKLGYRAVGWRSEDLLTWFENMQEEV